MPQFGLFRIAVFVFYNLICGKIKNMKTSTSRALFCIIIAICCTLNTACSYLRPEIPGSKPRSQTHNRNRPDRNGGDEDDEIKLKPDSVIVFAAVEFRESYDWLRDSAYGIEPFIIKLYRNFDPVLEIESSSEPAAPDRRSASFRCFERRSRPGVAQFAFGAKADQCRTKDCGAGTFCPSGGTAVQKYE